MAKITLRGGQYNTVGQLPKVGTEAPNFWLAKRDLSTVSLQEWKGKSLVLNIFPSLDTPVCATSIRKFNQSIDAIDKAMLLCISMDLPFAAERFCVAEGIKNVELLSSFRDGNLGRDSDCNFGRDYGVLIADGPLQGLLARAVVVIDPTGRVSYSQLVEEISQEPDYDLVLKSLILSYNQ